jgi:hypothetical protein
MLWSFGQISRVSAAERDPKGSEGLAKLGRAWEQRNRRAFLAGYLGLPGIGDLVPPARNAVRALVAAFELRRTAVESAWRMSAD